MVPTSDFESGGSNLETVRTVLVGLFWSERTDVLVKRRAWTFSPDARAAPTILSQQM